MLQEKNSENTADKFFDVNKDRADLSKISSKLTHFIRFKLE